MSLLHFSHAPEDSPFQMLLVVNMNVMDGIVGIDIVWLTAATLVVLEN